MNILKKNKCNYKFDENVETQHVIIISMNILKQKNVIISLMNILKKK